MTRSAIFVILLLILSFGGCIINQNLTTLHSLNASKGTVPEWFSGACKSDADETFDCTAVVQSKWGTFPFRDRDTNTGEPQLAIPVALIGWAYFAAVFVWMMLIGRVDYERRHWHRLLTVVILLGCAASIFFLYVMLTDLDHKCRWCLVSHAINFAMLILVFLIRPRPEKSRTETSAGADEAKATLPVVAIHPSWRLIFATVTCVGTVWMALFSAHLSNKSIAIAEAREKGYKDEIKRMSAGTDSQVAQFEGLKPVKIAVRPDDPQSATAEGPSTKLVIFSDFQCPGCRKFSKELEEKIKPTFDGHLRIVWKHFPLCTDCNVVAKRNIHPYACKLAYAAEAARMQGGNDAFWKLHDLLFKNQRFIVRLKPEPFEDMLRGFAEKLELDVERFDRDRTSPEVEARVKEDIALGKSIGVRGTPAAYFGGKRVQRFMLNFMAAMKKRFDQLVRRKQKHKGHNHAKPKAKHSEATP
ncbi:MAG: thioredoxin domain-containing protein [Planctomycetes bacterium]|nr:thioredoxin domain-containing protein [Planctomycetota bacterium]